MHSPIYHYSGERRTHELNLLTTFMELGLDNVLAKFVHEKYQILGDEISWLLLQESNNRVHEEKWPRIRFLEKTFLSFSQSNLIL